MKGIKRKKQRAVDNEELCWPVWGRMFHSDWITSSPFLSDPLLCVCILLVFLFLSYFLNHTLLHPSIRLPRETCLSLRRDIFLAERSLSFPPPFPAKLFSEVMNAIIWRGRRFHPALLAAGRSMKAAACYQPARRSLWSAFRNATGCVLKANDQIEGFAFWASQSLFCDFFGRDFI